MITFYLALSMAMLKQSAVTATPVTQVVTVAPAVTVTGSPVVPSLPIPQTQTAQVVHSCTTSFTHDGFMMTVGGNCTYVASVAVLEGSVVVGVTNEMNT